MLAIICHSKIVDFFLIWPSLFSLHFPFFQLQLSPSKSAHEHLNGNDQRSCIQLPDDDEIEMNDYSVGNGSQSIDCEASPPPLQVCSCSPSHKFSP